MMVATKTVAGLSPYGSGYKVVAASGLAAFEAAGFGFFAHRNLPPVYPEETIIGARAAVAAGVSTLELDCQMLADGALGVMHDSTINRIATTTGNVADHTAASWSLLTANVTTTLGGGWQNTTLPLFTDYLREFGNKILLVPEAKDNAGSGAAIVAALQRHGISTDMALVQSGYQSELSSALSAGYPTLLLLGTYSGSPTPSSIKAQGHRWVGLDFTTTSTAQMDALRAAGLKVAAYTVDTAADLAGIAAHCDAVFTDEEIYLRGSARRTTDPFKSQTWYHGHRAAGAGNRGAFFTPNMWGLNMASGNTWQAVLQGWASPLKGNASSCPSVTISFSVKFESAFTTDRFACLSIFDTDKPFDLDSVGPGNGYNFLCRKNGNVEIYYYTTGGSATNIATAATTSITDGGTASYTITVTPTDVTLARTDVAGSCTASHSAARGSYLHAAVKGVFAKFSGISIS